jgi:4-carboxymuconolactone decarboxylase
MDTLYSSPSAPIVRKGENLMGRQTFSSTRLRILIFCAGLISLTGCITVDRNEQEPVNDPINPIDIATEIPFAPSVVTESDIPSDIHHDSWARLPLPNRASLDNNGQRAYDAIINPDSRYADGPRGPIAMWLYSPAMAEHIFPASTYLRFGTEIDQRLTELAILATAREVRSQYEWSAHEPLALDAGLEVEIIEIVKYRQPLHAETPGLGETERLIIQFARELISEERLSSETFTRAQTILGNRGVMNLAGLIGYYNFVNLTLKTFDVQLAPGRTRLLPDLWTHNQP